MGPVEGCPEKQKHFSPTLKEPRQQAGRFASENESDLEEVEAFLGRLGRIEKTDLLRCCCAERPESTPGGLCGGVFRNATARSARFADCRRLPSEQCLTLLRGSLASISKIQQIAGEVGIGQSRPKEWDQSGKPDQNQRTDNVVLDGGVEAGSKVRFPISSVFLVLSTPVRSRLQRGFKVAMLQHEQNIKSSRLLGGGLFCF